MKKQIKKISISLLLITLVLTGLFTTTFKTKAATPTFGSYTQKESDMRAVWVATVSNLNISLQVGKSESSINKWKQQYLDILDNAEANNLNTIIFQVRPANDAFYPSKYNPWSTYLVQDGTDPGWDPLEWMIEVTHERGLEYHAWLNPYRATVSTLGKSITTKDSVTGSTGVIDYDTNEYNQYKEKYFSSLRDANPNITNPVLQTGENLYHDVLFGTEGKMILNPASPRVQEHIKNTIEEIVDNYDIDGIHFDDYFYPATATYKGANNQYKGYTFSCEPSVDLADYKLYLSECNGETLSIYDWRRENVNQLIKDLGELIRSKNETKTRKCAFGISPAARWAPSVEACSSAPERGAEGGMSGSCYNYYSYSDLYADTYKWAKEEWIDYIVPQNYTNLDGDYLTITKWWYNALEGCKTKLYIGTALYQITDTWSSNKQSEIYFQIRVNETKKYYVDGYVLFSYKDMLTSNGKKALSPIIKYVWQTDALTPLYDNYEYTKQVKTKSTVKSITNSENNEITLEFNSVQGAKGYGLFKFSNTEEVVFDVAHRIGLKLNNSTPFVFTKEDGYKYVLVTYDQDNTIYSEYTTLDLESKAPVVEVTTDKTIYQPLDKMKVNINITDEDSDSFKVTLQYIDGETKYNEVVKTLKSSADVEYDLPKITSNNGYLLVTVKDEFNTVKIQKTITITNNKPVVFINIPTSVVINDNVNIEVLCEDDSSEVKYKILLSYEGDQFMFSLGEGTASLQDGKTTISAQFTANTITSEAKIKVIISDCEYDVETISNSISIVEASNDDKGCNSGCNSAMVINQIIALTTIFTITLVLLRKEGN